MKDGQLISGGSGRPAAVLRRRGLVAVILVATAPLALLTSYQLFNGIRDEQQRAIADLGRSAAAPAIVSAAGCMLLGLLFGLWLARRLSAPLDPPASDAPADAIDATRILEAHDARLQRLMVLEQEARQQAESANRAKDEFLAMLGHELRNPLGAIASAVEVLQRTESDSALADRAIQIIGRQTTHLARLMDDLLDVARVLSGKVVLKRHPLDLAELTKRVIWTANLTGQGQQHAVKLDLAPVMVNGDAARLEQVVTNLLGNAFCHSPVARAIEITTARDGTEAVLRVLDHGDGIPAPLHERAFDLFVQGERSLDRRGGGLGVGLTLVRRLMMLHGGSVTASSSDEGSLFEVRMPALPAPGPTAS